MDRHASKAYKHHRVDVWVSAIPAGAHVEVVVHDVVESAADQLLEYVVSDIVRLDDALCRGVEIGCAVVDRSP